MARSEIKKQAAPKLDYDTLINGAGVTAGTITLYNNRSLADYIFLVAQWMVSGNIRASSVFRRVDLQDGYSELSYVDSENTQRWVDLKRVSDTSMNVTCSTNASGAIYLFGLTIVDA